MKNYKTRQWRHPEGYKYLAPWTNAVLLRFLIRKFTATLPRSEYRMKNQANDAARSVVANIEEGYKRPTTQEYLNFLGYSQASLEEVKGDIRRVHQDGFLKSEEGSTLSKIGINLKEFKELLGGVKGKLRGAKGDKDKEGLVDEKRVSPLNVPLEVLYPPLKPLKGFDLTSEIFFELINKTDWLLRQLVESLEKNISREGVLSPFDKWRERKEQNDLEENKKFNREALQEHGLVYTDQGVMKKQEADKKGLEIIDI